MVGTGAYLWRRNIPMSLKVIHARMVAQAGVIGGLCGVGAYSLLHETAPGAKPSGTVVDHNHFRETVVKAKPAAKVVAVEASKAAEIAE